MYIYSLLRLGEALERERAPGPQLRLLDAVRARQARARDERAHRAHALGNGLGARRTGRRAGLAERELVEAPRVPRRIPEGLGDGAIVVAIVACARVGRTIVVARIGRRAGRRENAQDNSRPLDCS